jgi:uncharacterized protein
MKSVPPPNLFARMLAWPVLRWKATLFAAAVIALLSTWSITQLRPATTLEPLFAKNDPSSVALVRVLNDFRAIEDLLLLVTAPERKEAVSQGPVMEGEEGHRLLDFAARLKEVIESDVVAAAMVSRIEFRASEDIRRFIEQTVVPAGLFYLNDAEFEAFVRRLRPESMRGQMARNEAMLATPSPATGALAKVVLQDPLRLHEFLLDHFATVWSPIATPHRQRAFISPDGRHLLVRISGKRPASDMEFTRKLMATMRKCVESARAGGLQTEFAGAYAIADISAREIRHDMIVSVASSIAMLQILFLLAYRNVLSFVLAFLPVVAGIVTGFGVYSLLGAQLTPVNAVVGAMLAGLGIDYSIHVLSHWEDRRSRGALRGTGVATTLTLFRTMLAACATSIAGFAAIGVSSVPTLKDFALLGALGLLGTFVASITVLPALLTWVAGSQREAKHSLRARIEFEPLMRWIDARAKPLVLSAGCVLVGLSVFVASRPGGTIAFESDLRVMHPQPNPPLETQERISRVFPGIGGSFMVHLHATGPRELVELAHRVDARLRDSTLRSAGSCRVFGLASLLPDPAVVEKRLSQIEAIDPQLVIRDFQAALADSALSEEACRGYEEFLRGLLRPGLPPGIEALRAFPMLADAVLPMAATAAEGEAATQAITFVEFDRSQTTREERAEAIDAIRSTLKACDGATLTGLTVVGHDIEQAVRRDLKRLMLVAAILVLTSLLIEYRRIEDALLALLPTAFGFVSMLAAMRLTDTKLNTINLVALPLLAGIGVDYGVFLVSAAKRSSEEAGARALISAFAPNCHAIVMCSLTTILGFGSLLTTKTPAIQSLGLAMSAAVGGGLAGTLFLLAPLLMLFDRRRANSPRSLERKD